MPKRVDKERGLPSSPRDKQSGLFDAVHCCRGINKHGQGSTRSSSAIRQYTESSQGGAVDTTTRVISYMAANTSTISVCLFFLEPMLCPREAFFDWLEGREGAKQEKIRQRLPRLS